MATGREPNGRFGPKNTFGQGNPALRRQRALADAVRAAIDGPSLQRVIAKLQDQAEEGDSQAASLLLQYALGRPREQAPEFDGLTLGDMATVSEAVQALAEIARRAAAGEIPVDIAERLTKLVQVCIDEAHTAKFDERLRALEKP